MTDGRDLDQLCPSRRSVLRTLAALGGVTLVPGVLSACTSSTTEKTDNAATVAGSATGAASAANGAKTTVAASSVKVGTAVVVAAKSGQVVVAQPSAGKFVAFSAKCTHEGKLVMASSSTTVTCPAHGSQFDLADGAKAVKGPAQAPLSPVTVSVSGSNLILG